MPDATPSRLPRSAYLRGAGVTPTAGGACKKRPPFNYTQRSLAPGQILAFALDAALRLYVSFETWRRRRQTLQALADLDERLLSDIGVARGETTPWSLGAKSRNALAMLDDTELIHLSDLGRQVRREAQHGGSDESRL